MTVSAETSTTSSYGCIRLRGLPFTASYHDIAQFLSGYSVIDVLISKSEGMLVALFVMGAIASQSTAENTGVGSSISQLLVA